MQVIDTTNATTVFFAAAAKSGPRGRKFFAIDSLSTGDKAFMLSLIEALAVKFPAVQFAIVDAKGDRPMAPRELMAALGVDDEEDEDVNLDELSDDEL